MNVKEKKKRILRLGIVILAFLVIMIPLMVLSTAMVYGPTSEMDLYVSETDYSIDGDFTIFSPENSNGKGIILYPGAFVEAQSYGYLAKRLSENGFLVCLLSVPIHLSILASNKADSFISLHPEISSWVVGGHSMGGVSAAIFASKNLARVDGLILLASYPASSTDLSNAELPVLSIYAELDGLTTLSDIEESKALLPEDTVFAKINGGNHAGFGMYGDQKKDNQALITNIQQQNAIVELILNFFQ